MAQPEAPRAMSTQHPDNVSIPFFADGEVLHGETEVKEAYYVFSHLGVQEQMWDCEGKEVDSYVVEKLLSKYPDYFARHPLGDELRLTIRVPNPEVEKKQAKILLETLESIPRHYDTACAFGKCGAPIFEVILPMTQSARQILRIENYYEKVVVGKGDIRLDGNDITIREWIGESKPGKIRMIPLIEDRQSMHGADKIVGDYLAASKRTSIRVFLARSDPALNYGSIGAVLTVKAALWKLAELEEKSSVKIEPIIGVGSSPFRGNLKPTNPGNCLGEYPSVQTFSIQSSFKYDYPPEVVRTAIERINSTVRGKPLPIDLGVTEPIVEKTMKAYQDEITLLAPFIARISKHVPQRRARKLHVGLFGYSRTSGGVKLPRAIAFCASLYSLGIPPEILGLDALNEKDWDTLHSQYANIEEDLQSALSFANPSVFEYLPPLLQNRFSSVLKRVGAQVNEDAALSSSEIWKLLDRGDSANIKETIIKSAWIRGFLG